MLVVEALENCRPIAQNDTIIEHSCKVDLLIVEAQRKRKKLEKNCRID